MHPKTVFVLLSVLLVPPVVHGGRWFLTFETANNWMAGYVGDVIVCFHFRPNPNETVESVDVVNVVNTNGTATTIRTMDDADDDDDHDQLVDNRLEDCQTIPWRSFERAKTYIFGMDFIKNNELDKVRLFTKLDNSTVCKRKTLDTWHVQRVTFQNRFTGQLFEKLESNDDDDDDDQVFEVTTTSKPFKNPKKSGKKFSSLSEVAPPTTTMTNSVPSNVMFIGPKCGGGGGDKGELILDDFNVSVRPRPCEFSGTFYKDGERFEDGCVGICNCRDGGVSCVSRCPPYIVPGCRHVHEPNECCQNYICDTLVQRMTCPIYEENDCETANRTVTPGEFPWTAFVKLCDNKAGCSRYCSGALLSDQWVLSAAECVSWPGINGKQATADQIRVIVGESTLFLAEDNDIELAVESVISKPGGGGGLVLIKLKERVMFDKVVQPALLPDTKEHCLQLLQPYCGVTLTGWMNVGTPAIEQYELYKLNTRLEEASACPSPMTTTTTTTTTLAPPTSFRDRRRKLPPPPRHHRSELSPQTLCVNMGNDEPDLSVDCGTCQPENDLAYTCVSDKNTQLCSGEKGRMLVSRVQVPQMNPDRDFKEVDILVGVVTYNHTAKEESLLCRSQAHWLAVGICNELAWIATTTV